MSSPRKMPASLLLVATIGVLPGNAFPQEGKKTEVPAKLAGHKIIITGLSVFPDGKRAATVADDGVILWNLDERSVARKHPLPRGFTVAVSPDNQWIAGGGLDGDLVMWDAASGKEHLRLALGTSLVSIYELAFSPDSKTLAAVVQNNIHLYDVAGKNVVHHLQLRSRKLQGIAFSRDGKTLTCAADQESTFRPKPAPAGVVQWSTATGKLLREFPVAVSGEDRLFYSPDGKTLIGKAGFLRFFDADSGKEVRSIERYLRIFALSKDGTMMLGGENSAPGVHVTAVYDTATGKRIGRLPEWSSLAAFHPDGQTLLTRHGNEVLIWDIRKLPRDDEKGKDLEPKEENGR